MGALLMTEVLDASTGEAQRRAVELLRAGQVIAIPTDTVYGVAVEGMDAGAIENLYVVKDRPRDKPIPLLLASADDLSLVASNIPDGVRVLAKFWPGGLTLVLPALNSVPAVLRAEGNSVGVRVPNHSVPRSLARALGYPIACTSANLSGEPNPSNAQEVLAQLGGRIPLVLDGGQVGEGLPSTVVDFTTDPPSLVRAGALPVKDLELALGYAIAR